MTHQHHQHDSQPWHDQAGSLVERLEEEARLTAPLREAILRESARAIDRQPQRIVELGSGIGADAVALAQRFPSARVHALDVSEELLELVASGARAAGVGDRTETRRVDLNHDWAYAIPPGVDLVWAAGSLHHLGDPARALRRTFAALRPGGALVLIEPRGAVRVRLGESEPEASGLADRVARELSVPAEYTGIDWAGLLEGAGFASEIRYEQDLVVDARSAEGAGHLEAQFCSVRDRIAPDLTDAERRRFDAVIDSLRAGEPGISVTSTREVRVAVRPPLGGAPSSDRPETVEVDAAVLGGGPAGLAAAVALARSRRSVVLIDAGEPRNAAAAGAHNVLGQEGVPPLELLARGRAEAESYGVRILPGTATAVDGGIDDFAVDIDGGTRRVHARRLILAGGLEDDLPEIPGVAQGWGHSVLHCPFCHGWEVRDQRIALLGRGETPIHQAVLFRQLSDDVTVFLHDAPDPTEEEWEQLAELGVPVVRPRVERLVMDGARVRGVEIEGGRVFDADAAVVVPRFNARTGLYASLGGVPESTPFGIRIPVGPTGSTDIPGVWAAGNAGNPMAMVVASAASGVAAGAAVHGDLAMSDLERAVRARRDASR